MDLLSKSVFQQEFTLTRHYLQDVAKVVGRVQQLFVPPADGDRHYGLEVWPEGISSQSFTWNNQPQRILINLEKGTVAWDKAVWPLAEVSGPALHAEFSRHLAAGGFRGQLGQPDYTQEESSFLGEFAQHFIHLTWWAHEALTAVQSQLPASAGLPPLLYPHHFDISSQCETAGPPEQTFTYGFSPGDTVIKDPYFYVTADPETKAFVEKPVPSPAYWQSEGFTGAVMRLQDFWLADDVTARARDFIVHMLAADASTGSRSVDNL